MAASGMIRKRMIDLSFATFFRGLVVAALVWAWLTLWPWVLVFVLAAFIAVTLDPAVAWLDARGLRRRFAAPLVIAVIAGAVVGFIVLSAASLSSDAAQLASRIRDAASDAFQQLPAGVQRTASSLAPSPATLVGAGQALLSGLAGVGVALVVTVYLLIDGGRTYRWLLAFVPVRARDRAEETAECARGVAGAYVRGNSITSLLTAVCTWIALLLLDVPAALLLALLAGLFDFIPVVGFLLSAAPAVVLALAVSPVTALGVAAFYVAFNLVENYYIQPLVYGQKMHLSSLAVISAFLVGGTLGGVLGALIALPLAAMYPSTERIWAGGRGSNSTAREHARIQKD
jgi:predicted PurR-regulated permease PerM